MRVSFSKYHGAGNDFIILDGSFQTFLSEVDIAFLCDRHMGIGADGVIFLTSLHERNVQMKYFNSDGKESTMCGNGGRCAVAYIHKTLGWKEGIVILASDGTHHSQILSYSVNQWQIAIQMSDAGLPVASAQGFAINTGSPHHVEFVESIDAIDVHQLGAALRNHFVYAPHGTNVDFVEERDGVWFVRTYERGVENETMACGTGVTAVALTVAFLKEQHGSQNIQVTMPGGNLRVKFHYSGSAFTDIWLEGPAVHVFDGVIEIP